MKKTLFILASILTFASFVPHIQAFSWTNAGSKDSRQSGREELRQTKQSIREQSLSEREKIREEWKAGTLEAADKLGELHATTYGERSSFYYKRLSGILARLDQAIKDAETKYGANQLKSSRSFWTQAKSKLDTAKTLADAAVSAFKNITGDKVAERKAALIAAREKVRLATIAYKDASRLMKEASKSLRIVIQTNKPSPSPKASFSPRPFGRKPNASPVIPPSAN